MANLPITDTIFGIESKLGEKQLIKNANLPITDTILGVESKVGEKQLIKNGKFTYN